MAITGPHEGGLWCCWFQKPQAHCEADPCVWEGMVAVGARGRGGGWCTEVAVRHMKPEIWSSLHHGHKQGHDSRDPSTVWTCDHGQATSPLWASLRLLGYKMGNHSGLSRSCTLRSQ